MKVAVVGATGMVGQVMLKVLEERNLPITELIPVASERSVGNKIKFKNKFLVLGMIIALVKKRDYIPIKVKQLSITQDLNRRINNLR